MQTAGTAVVIALAFFSLSLFSEVKAQQSPRVALETNRGTFVLELNQEKAPITVDNFLKYVEEGFYDNTIFHRVIGPSRQPPRGFMIQGGGFEAGSTPKEKATKSTIKNEAANGLSNSRGTIAMARTSDPDSASAQFFINLSDNTFLDHRDKSTRGYGYAVFGQVVEGMDVVDKIASVETADRVQMIAKGPSGPTQQPFDDVPTDPVIIQSARVVSN